MDSLDITKERVITWLKDHGELYTSIHVIDEESEQEVYINNIRVMWWHTTAHPIEEDVIDLFMTPISGFWNGSASERANYQSYYPFHEKRLPKSYR